MKLLAELKWIASIQVGISTLTSIQASLGTWIYCAWCLQKGRGEDLE